MHEGPELKDAWNGEYFNGLRQRFQSYRVRLPECSECAEFWIMGMAGHSPSIAEYDTYAMQENEGEGPRVIRIDLRAKLSEADLVTLQQWLPGAEQVHFVTTWPLADAASNVLQEITKMRAEKGFHLIIQIVGAFLGKGSLPDGTSDIVWDLSGQTELLAGNQRKQFDSLIRKMEEEGSVFEMVATVGKNNWIHLRTWLEIAHDINTRLTIKCIPASEEESLAELDADVLGSIHAVFRNWLAECPSPPGQGKGTNHNEGLLARILYWQQNKTGKGKICRDFALPKKNILSFPTTRLLHPFSKGCSKSMMTPGSRNGSPG